MKVDDFLLTMNLLANAFVTGGVFMNVFVVWPAARETLGQRGFPLEFLAMQGKRIAPWLYTGLLMLLLTSVGLLFLRPPASTSATLLLLTRLTLVLGMLGNTLYGTLRTWPAIQFSTDTEGWGLWAGYAKRGRAMFACAVGAFILGTQAAIHRF